MESDKRESPAVWGRWYRRAGCAGRSFVRRSLTYDLMHRLPPTVDHLKLEDGLKIEFFELGLIGW
jgi:hypothetical protein